MFMCWIAWTSHSSLRNQGINRFQSPTAPIGNMLQRGQNMEGTRQNRANIVIDDSGSPLLTRDTEFIHVLYNETTNSLVCTTKDRYLIVVVLSFLYLVGIPKRILLKSISCVSGWKNSTLCSKCMLEPIFSLKSRILSLLLPLQTYSQIRHRLSCLICKIIHQSSSMYFLIFIRITI